MLFSMYRLSVWIWISSPLSLSGLLAYQADVFTLKSPPRIRSVMFDVLQLWDVVVRYYG